MRELFERVLQIARSLARVLIEGESGTGKELIAQAIHFHSPRRRGPFVAVNCASFTGSLFGSELFGHMAGAFTGAARDKVGLVERADQGDLFLDEVGEMDLAVQAHILRFLESGEYSPVGSSQPRHANVRLIAATNRDLAKLVREGKFREDLYYRLKGSPLSVPPLRERGEDIPLLAHFFLAALSQACGRSYPTVERVAIRVLEAYDWPGNVRELKNCLENLLVTDADGCISAVDVIRHLKGSPGVVSDVPGSTSEDDTQFMKRYQEAFRKHGDNKAAIARELGMHRCTVYRRMVKLGLIQRGHRPG
jgi:transcriptional regulator with PAS, ATPase and Fis domain